MKLDTLSNAELLSIIHNRFVTNIVRHKNIEWSEVESRIVKNQAVLTSLSQMEATGGEPDLVVLPEKMLSFVDCSPESPAARRSLCYDEPALAARKANKPKGSALAMAQAMGVELLTENEYRFLQTLGEFDTKTSSWIQTPAKIRLLGGALFADRRYDSIFVYHNGADSYYAARGFRAMLRI